VYLDSWTCNFANKMLGTPGKAVHNGHKRHVTAFERVYEFGQWQTRNIPGGRECRSRCQNRQISVNDPSISRVALDRSDDPGDRHEKSCLFLSTVSFFFLIHSADRLSSAMRARNLTPEFFCRRAFVFAPFLARSLSPVISLIWDIKLM